MYLFILGWRCVPCFQPVKKQHRLEARVIKKCHVTASTWSGKTQKLWKAQFLQLGRPSSIFFVCVFFFWSSLPQSHHPPRTQSCENQFVSTSTAVPAGLPPCPLPPPPPPPLLLHDESSPSLPLPTKYYLLVLSLWNLQGSNTDTCTITAWQWRTVSKLWWKHERAGKRLRRMEQLLRTSLARMRWY